MGLYEIEMGRLLDGQKEHKGIGQYYIVTPEEYLLTDSLEDVNGIHYTMANIEEMLYQGCRQNIQKFAASNHNQAVYTFSIFVDSSNGMYLLYLNNHSYWQQVSQYYFNNYTKSYKETGNELYNRSLEQVQIQMKFAAGAFPFRLDDLGDEIDTALDAYRQLNEQINDHEEYMNNPPTELTPDKRQQLQQLDTDSITIIDAVLMNYDGMYAVAIRALERLQTDLKQLDQTDDFIAYVCSSNGEGGEILTWTTLARKSNSIDRIYLAKPEEKKYDIEIEQVRIQQAIRPVEDQLNYWIGEIKNNAYNLEESILYHCNKSDYWAYTEILNLGKDVLPILEKALQFEEDRLVIEVYEMLLEDLRHG